MEDNASVRELSTREFSQSGYVVFGAATVREALERSEQEEGEFDLLFCDVVLPDGRGPELVKRLLKCKPGIRVLLSSGYPDEKSDWRAIQGSGSLNWES